MASLAQAATGDPWYCFEHKCWYEVCQREKHLHETDEQYEKRMGAPQYRVHGDCPYCQCQDTPLSRVGWRL